MDVEQRLTLESVWMALQDAGFNKAKLIREPRHVGVWVGISGSDWQWVPLPPGAAPGMGSSEAVIAGRCTFCLNLKGPSMIINTACSASLVSTHSCKLQMNFKPDALEAGIATGISINTTPHVFIEIVKPVLFHSWVGHFHSTRLPMALYDLKVHQHVATDWRGIPKSATESWLGVITTMMPKCQPHSPEWPCSRALRSFSAHRDGIGSA